MKHLRLIGGLGIVTPFLLSGPVTAQDVEFIPVDRIIAVVGRTPIPESRIAERLQLMRLQNPDLPTDSASLEPIRRAILDSLIVNELLVRAAELDSMVQVSDEDVQGAADAQLRRIREGFVSELDFQQQIRASGFATVDEYRLWLSRDIRRQMLTDGLLGWLRQKGDLRPIAPTEEELRERYVEVLEMQRAQPRPATVSFRQVVVTPVPDSAAMRAAFIRADSVMRRARAGEDFASLVSEFSDDTTSIRTGGDVGWLRRGAGFAKAFERAAFSIRPGQISPPVQTAFGFHVIQVVRSEPAEVQARHILIAPQISDGQKALARMQADSVAQMLRRGAALDSVLRRYHDFESNEQSFAERAIMEQLPPFYRDALTDAQPGDVIGPITLPPRVGLEKYAVVLFQERLEAGEYTFEEMRDQLRDQLANRNGLARYVDALRQATYVDVRR